MYNIHLIITYDKNTTTSLLHRTYVVAQFLYRVGMMCEWVPHVHINICMNHFVCWR